MNALTETAVRRILVIDDSPDVHDDFRKALTLRNAACDELGELEAQLFGSASGDDALPTFEIASAMQGRAGLELVRQAKAAGRPFLVAFVDVRMPPGWDGLETVRRMWAVDPGLEIVVCTAYSDHSWRQILAVTEHSGLTDQLLILKKPFQVDEARQLALALSSKRLLKEAARERSADLERLVAERTRELADRNARLEHEIGERQAALRRLAEVNRARSRHARALSVLLELSTRLASVDDVETAAGCVTEAAARVTRARRAALLLPDRERRVLRVARACGAGAAECEGLTVEVGAGVAGRVFSERTALIVNAPSSAPPVLERGADAACFVGTPLVSRPLTSNTEVIGVLSLSGHDLDRPYAVRELSALDTVCNMAASAIGDILTRQARDEARDSIVTALATLVECRDDDTGRHLDRVTGYSLILAKALRASPFGFAEINDEFLQNLRRAVPLHDIGKVGIPDEILFKPGRLTESEMAVMRRHTEIGARTIRAMMRQSAGASFLAMAGEIAIAHHEHYDGRGYPNGLRGQDIPLAARITAVADVYDALTTTRPYKAAYPHERAVAMIQEESGRHFDPVVAAAFSAEADRFQILAERLADRPEAGESASVISAAQIIDEVLRSG